MRIGKQLLRKWFVYALITTVVMIFAGMAFLRVKREPVSRSGYVMGTLVEITTYDRGAEAAVDAAFNRMAEIERQVGRDDTSDLSRINTLSTKEGISVGPDTWNILTTARKYWELTDKVFDVTVGPLVNLWGFGYDGEGRMPSPEKIEAALPKVGSDKITFIPDGRRIGLAKSGMAISVGGIAKGYAVQEAARILAERGVKNALINGGMSSIKVLGTGSSGKDWRVGIEDPRDTSRIIGTVRLKSGQALGTSADDRRYFIKDGKRYSHIIDPRTGYPADKGIASVTVITEDATRADILTKALFLHDVQWDLAFAARNDIGAVIIEDSGKIWTTPGTVLE